MHDMNVFFQICGLVIVGIILLSFLMKKKMVTRNNLIFVEMLLLGIFSLGIDIVKFEFFRIYDDIPREPIEDITKLQLFTLIAMNYLLLRYLSHDLFKTKTVKRLLLETVATIIIGASIFVVFPLPIKFINMGQYNAYAQGAAVYATYGFIGAYLFLVYVFTIVKENTASSKRKRTLRIWIYIWALAIALEVVINHLFDLSFKMPIIEYAQAISLLVLYIVLENPDYSIDKETITFNQTKCMEYVYDLHRKNKEYYVLVVVSDLSNPALRNYKLKQETLFSYAKSLEKIKKGKVFKGDNDTFIVVSKKLENLDVAINTLLEKYNSYSVDSNSIEASHNLKFIKVESPNVCGDSANLFDILREETSTVRYNRNSEVVNVLDESSVNKMNEERRMEGIVNDAIKNDRILVYLQPIYSLEEKKFVSAEALTRIMDSDGKIIYPGSFIEVCEKNGSIFMLGTLVFEHICRFIQKYNMEALGLHYIEVNLSAIQCEYEGIADLYITIMEKYGVNPKYINLEITETGNANRAKMIENMYKLVEYGVSFSLDDFGTGNSNLNYIVDMPVSLVKFDKEMVNSYFEDKKAKFVMNSAITMIKDMDLKIVLEGIEEKSQISSIQRRKEKIDFIQGYYYSKPINEDDFVAFVKDKNKVKEEILNIE